jgi:hypothetical protein
MQRSPIEYRSGKSFNLFLVGVSVLAKRPMELAILDGKTFHVSGFMEPRQIELAGDTSILAVYLKGLHEVSFENDREIQMP